MSLLPNQRGILGSRVLIRQGLDTDPSVILKFQQNQAAGDTPDGLKICLNRCIYFVYISRFGVGILSKAGL